MNDSSSRTIPKIESRSPTELSLVATNCNPASDTQDRLRLLFTILVNLAGEGTSLSGTEHSLYDGGEG